MPNIGRNILPSHLQIGETAAYYDGNAFDNLRLRFGEVQEIIYPDNPKNLSKKFVEYSVYVQHRANSTGVGMMYDHCILANPLAGLADECEFTLRPGKQPSTSQQGSNGLGLGSKVLILCLNGETNNAIIVNGLRDQSDKRDLNAKDLGHHLHFVFNGISFDVNKDGELSVAYGGATKVDGTTDVSDSITGSTVKFLKNGNVSVADKDNKNQVLIDHENKKVSVVSEDTVVVTANQVNVDGQTCTFGKNADSFMVRGDQLKTILTSLTAALTAFTTGLNPASLAAQASTLNGAIPPILNQINSIMLSEICKVK